MSVSYCGRRKRISSGQACVVLFAILLSWLLLSLVLLHPADTFAKVYVWKDGRGKTHLTDRPPPEENANKPIRNFSEPEQQQAAPSAVRQDVREVVDTVETAFRKNDIDRLMQVYTVPGGNLNKAEEQVAKETLASSLRMFFDAFGTPGKFTALSAGELPQQLQQNEFIPSGCAPSFRGFSFPFSGSDATGLVYLTICGSGKEARLVSFTYDLKNPTPEQQQKFADITRETLKQVADKLQQQQSPKPPVRQQPVQTHPRSPAAGKKAPVPSAPPPGAARPAPAPQGQAGLPGLQQQPGAFSLPGQTLPNGLDLLALMQLGSLFTGMAMLIQIAVSLLFYFFTSLCMYLIARKTDTRGAWLAWVPLLQIFPMIQSSGIAWWWGLVLYFAPLPLMLIPVLNVFAMVAWLVVLVVFFVVVWMRICQRLGMNKWLGLVMFVPLFNMVLMALLAFNSESTGPEVAVKPVVARTVLAYVLATVVLCGALYLYVMPLMETLLSQSANLQQFNMPGAQQQLPAVRPQAQAVPQQKQQPQKGAAPAKPAVALDSAYYEALFKKKAPGFSDDSFESGRPQTCVGPACVLLSTFWGQQDAHVWLKIRIPDIPYMTLFDSSTMTISDVLNRSGKNVYDTKSSFESEHFLNLRFMNHSGGYLEAIRDVHLLPGTKEGDLKTVRGDLKFQFPMNVRSADFGPSDAGKKITAAGLEITLEKFEGTSVKIQVAGDIGRYIGVKAFDAAGRELEAGGSSSMTSENKKFGSYSFQGQIASLRVFAAEKIVAKSYTVTLDVP